jgi:hypothetical protein
MERATTFDLGSSATGISLFTIPVFAAPIDFVSSAPAPLKSKFLSSIFAGTVCLAGTLLEAKSMTVEFARDIGPLLEAKCLRCHNSNTSKGDISMATLSEIQTAGEDLLIPGNPDESKLHWITLPIDNGEPPEMPEEGEPLTKQEAEMLATWIREGANWPAEIVLKEPSKADKTWWSFQPLAEAKHQSIDAHIEARLNETGLVMNPEADKRTLIRRVTFDLTGLPPTPQEVEAFLYDSRPSAYQKLVDRLLASPRYGERWAQHWLDVIRWAETVGFETNAERKNAWPYRDWVIDSLNSDKPYDRFIFEQLAGDTVGEDAALGFLIAGPANLPGQIGRDEAAMRSARQDELDEVVNTVGQAFFGVTIGCARCHDHKFDPILQKDYYSMQAIFAGLSYGDRRRRGTENDEWASRVPAARDKLAALQAERETIRVELGLRKPIDEIQTEIFAAVPAQAIRMRIFDTGDKKEASLYEFEVWSVADEGDHASNVALASNGAQPSASSFALANQSRHFDNLTDGSIDKRQAYPWIAKEVGPAWIQVNFANATTIDRVIWHSGSSTPADYVIEALRSDSKEWIEVAHTRDRLPRIDDRRKVDDLELPSLDQDQRKKVVDLTAAIRDAENELARLTAGPRVYAASFSPEPEDTYLLQRGDAMQRKAKMQPDIPEVLGKIVVNPDAPESERRLALARHLTQPDHPLTARVIVNRIWQHHFGVGLVETSSDFGYMGTAPSHPELLDWLAERFVAEGWSLKQLHRRILTSKVYLQSSAPRSDALAVDADSRLLWRYPPRRLEAEAIRDSILSVSGKLNLEMGGPGFNFFNHRGGLANFVPKETFDEAGWRRMIYAHKVRMVSIDVFGAFDCPDAGQMQPSRTRSITPIQSLGLLNSPFVNRQATFFASRLYREAGDNTPDQIDHAFALVFSRPPSPLERERLTVLAESHGLEQVCRALFNTSEFAFIQ